MRRRSQRTALGLLIGVAVACDSCGAGAVTHAQYVARAGAICESTARVVRAVPPPPAGAMAATGLPALPLLATYTRRALPLLEAELTRLRAIPRPEAERADLAGWLASLSRDASAFAALGRAAQAGDSAGAQAALMILRASGSARIAVQNGITGCASAATVP